MSPLDYLRAMARRPKKPATGGIVRYDPTKPLPIVGGCDLTVPPAPVPAANLTIRRRELTPAEAQRFAEGLRLAVGASPGPASRERAAQAAAEPSELAAGTAEQDGPTCLCGVIYSRCYYPATHAVATR